MGDRANADGCIADRIRNRLLRFNRGRIADLALAVGRRLPMRSAGVPALVREASCETLPSSAFSFFKTVCGSRETFFPAPGSPGRDHPYFAEPTRYQQTPRRVVTIENARVLSHPHLVIHPDGFAITELSATRIIESDPLKRCLFPPARRLPGKTLTLLTEAGTNYCHWLFDLLPKVKMLRDADIEPAAFDTILVPSFCRDYERRTFERLGIPADRVLATGPLPGCYLCESLTATTRCHFHPVLEADSVAFIREQLAPDGAEPSRRIFVDRNRAQWRRLTNLTEIQEILKAFQFETVAPETLSFDQQRQLFAEASHVVGVHGAGFSNILFCPISARVAEIFAPSYVETTYYNFCHLCGIHYDYLYGEGSFPDNLEHSMERLGCDVTVDPTAFEGLLKRLTGGRCH